MGCRYNLFIVDYKGVLQATTLYKSSFCDTIIGTNIKELLSREHATTYMDALDTVLKTGKKVYVEYSLGKRLYLSIIVKIDCDTAYSHEIEIQGSKARAKKILQSWVKERNVFLKKGDLK